METKYLTVSLREDGGREGGSGSAEVREAGLASTWSKSKAASGAHHSLPERYWRGRLCSGSACARQEPPLRSGCRHPGVGALFPDN